MENNLESLQQNDISLLQQQDQKQIQSILVHKQENTSAAKQKVLQFFQRQESYKEDEDIMNVVDHQIQNVQNDLINKIVTNDDFQINLNEGKQSINQSQLQKYNKHLQNQVYLNEKLAKITYSANTSPIRNIENDISKQQKNSSSIKLRAQLSPSEFDIKAKNFVKSLRQDQKQRQEKLQQMNQSVIEKRKQEFDESMKRDLERVQNIKYTREQQIEEAMNKIKLRKEEREKQFNEWVSFQKSLKNNEPLYIKYQREYEERVLLPQINNDKMLLNQIRDTMRKPLSKEEFQEHELKYREKQKMFELEQQQKRKNQQSPDQSDNDKKTYKSSHYQLLKQIDNKSKREHEDKIEQLRKLRQKQETYDKFVKECHPAKVSPIKHNELISNINKIKHPVKTRKQSYDNYLIEFQKVQLDTQQDRTSQLRYASTKNSSVNDKNLDSSTLQTHKKKINYLREFQQQRQAQTALNSPTQQNKNSSKLSIQRDLIVQLKKKNLTQEQKYEIVKLKSQAIEQKAKQYEHGYSHQALEMQNEVNQLYLDSIKTKMALLDEL